MKHIWKVVVITVLSLIVIVAPYDQFHMTHKADAEISKIVSNGDFETGNANEWVSNGGTLAVTSSVKHSGSYGLEIQRGAWSHYAGQQIVLQGGTEYAFSAWIRLSANAANRNAAVSLDYGTGTLPEGVSSRFVNIAGTADKPVTDSDWYHISGTYMYSGADESVEPRFLVQIRSNEGTVSTEPFYLDDVQIFRMQNVGVNGGLEMGIPSGWNSNGGVLSVVQSEAFSGNYALKVSRTKWNHAARQQLHLRQGAEYTISARVKLAAGSAPRDIKMLLDFGAAPFPNGIARQFFTVAQSSGQPVDGNGWYLIEGSYTYNGEELNVDSLLVFQMQSNGNPPGLEPFFVDDLQVIMKTELTSFPFELIPQPTYILPSVQSVPEIVYEHVFYVDPNGNDANPGTLDQPFLTISRARDVVRVYKDQHPTTDVIVLLRGGVYPIDQTITFGANDSGHPEQTITYAAFPGEQPIIHSGKLVSNWVKPSETLQELPAEAVGNVYVADLPTGLDTIKTLYQNDQRLNRARSEGFLPTEKYSSWKGTEEERSSFHFPPGAMEAYSNFQDVEVIVRPTAAWMMNILPLESVNTATYSAKTAIPAVYTIGQLIATTHITDETIWVENALQYLDEPGEWMVDSENRQIYLWPVDEEQMNGIYAPSLTQYMEIQGEIDPVTHEERPVINLVFSGLTFTQGERYSLNAEDDLQLEMEPYWDLYNRPNALVRLRITENIVIRDCVFTESGSNAIRMDLYNKNNLVYGNEISHIGGTGVLLNGYHKGNKDVNRGNQIINNHIHHIGEIYWYSPAIFAWQSGNNRIAFNRVSQTPYSGIVISSRMLTEQSPNRFGTGNVVEYNDISHVMNVLADGNAIYLSGSCLSSTTGACSSNIVRRNLIHDVPSTNANEMIRTDEQQSGTQIAQNIIYGIEYGDGIVNKQNNNVVNNIVADLQDEDAKYFRLALAPVNGSIIQRNIAYANKADQTIFTEGRSSGSGQLPYVRDTYADYNNYYNSANAGWAVPYFELQRGFSVERNSVSTNPLFYDLAHGDLRLQPDSAMLGLGFQQFDTFPIGLLENFPYADENEALGRLFIHAGDNPSAVELSQGQSVPVSVYGRTVSGYVKNLDDISISYASSDASVAAISANGQLTAVGSGEAYITAATGGVSVTIAVHVNDSVEQLYFATVQSAFQTAFQQHVYIGALTEFGNYRSIPAEEITWSSSDSSIVTVDESGLVSPLREGTVTLTAAWGGLTTQRQFAVFDRKMDGMHVLVDSLELSVDDTVNLHPIAVLDDGNAAKESAVVIQYSSDDESVLQVNASGMIIAKTAGTASVHVEVSGYGGVVSRTLTFQVSP